MEKITKQTISSRLNIHVEQQLLDQELARQAEEQKRLKEEAEQQRREQWHIEHEMKARESVFEMLARPPFQTNDTVTADYYSHDSDDGISDTTKATWSFTRDGEVVILTSKSRYDRNGWGSPTTRAAQKVWLFASDIDNPLVADIDPDRFFDTPYPINMDHFQPGRWDSVEAILQSIVSSVEREAMVAKLEKVLYEHGIIESGIKEYGRTKEIMRLEVAVNSHEIIRLVKTTEQERDSEYVQYTLRFSDINKMSGYVIRIDKKNVIPRVHMDGNKTFDSQYSELHDNYIDMFNQAISRVYAKLNPSLFDKEDIG